MHLAAAVPYVAAAGPPVVHMDHIVLAGLGIGFLTEVAQDDNLGSILMLSVGGVRDRHGTVQVVQGGIGVIPDFCRVILDAVAACPGRAIIIIDYIVLVQIIQIRIRTRKNVFFILTVSPGDYLAVSVAEMGVFKAVIYVHLVDILGVMSATLVMRPITVLGVHRRSALEGIAAVFLQIVLVDDMVGGLHLAEMVGKGHRRVCDVIRGQAAAVGKGHIKADDLVVHRRDAVFSRRQHGAGRFRHGLRLTGFEFNRSERGEP